MKQSTLQSSRMLVETLEAPAAIARQLAQTEEAMCIFGSQLRADPPRAVLTIARGSSDHAASFMAYLIMARLGRLVTSLPMSLITLYQAKIDCCGLLAMAFSQSGESPDLVAPLQYFSAGGATTVAFVNAENSPLAAAAQHQFSLCAGSETSVAATKSFIAQMVAGVRLLAAWQDDPTLHAAIAALPDHLTRATHADWSAGVDALVHADRLFVIGRGAGQAVAMEAALKFKETCAIQAEAFSGAEIEHGPMALIEAGYPILVFAPRGPAQAGLLATAQAMRARGAAVLLAAPAGTPGCQLPIIASDAVDLDPISMVQSFYPMVEAVARARGIDPDRPRHLAKVTRTR